MRIDPPAELVLHNSAPHHRLSHNALHMLRLYPPIPDPIACQWVLLTPLSCKSRRNVDDHVARKLVTTDMANQANPGHLVVAAPLYPLQIPIQTPDLNGFARNVEPLPLELLLKFVPQHGSHGAAPHVSPAVPTYQHQHILDVLHPRQQALKSLLSSQSVAMHR